MKNEYVGTYLLILHFHIPYVLHHDRMNEEWLYEAVAETYIPLLNILHRLARKNISPKITLDISPVLAEQLATPYFVKEFQHYCHQKSALAQEDKKIFARSNPEMERLATLWQKFYYKTKHLFTEQYEGDIIKSFRHLQEKGHIEIMSCGATHGYFPAFAEDASINAQIRMARSSYERLFGISPRGIWLPECGYRPPTHWTFPLTSRKHRPARFRRGIEEFLGENGFHYFIIDQEQYRKSSSKELDKTPWDTYYLQNPRMQNPVSLFVRDADLSEQIWDFRIGYPGDGRYLDFHKKHWGSGNRYWRITDKHLDMAYKEIYAPESVKDLITQQAGHYKWYVKRALKRRFLKNNLGGLKVTAFDAELFGHWWFEGPAWLHELLKWIHGDPEIGTFTCSEYRERYPANQYIQLPESSWGKGADSSTWINPGLEWVWERIYSAEEEMRHLADHFKDQKDPFLRRILQQCIRELLILQSSDWEFMISTNSTKDHGERRIVEHHEDFKRLVHLAYTWEHDPNLSTENLRLLKECEKRECIFTDPDPHWYL
ncbi:MAG: 1,4-alpha-glucan branching protein domain-containing protein [bacterium]